MKKKFKMENLDCANCAAKMEEGIKKIDGVEDVSISFMTQKMIIEADESKLENIMKEASKVVAKVDSECRIIL
ncbi:MAG: heavy-metal-associated domain-containing protein [Lachnospiraceae bacterium]|nr:heavy-metal-associated domain-containing protein [Lachnospiraceae bacterium]